MNFKKLGNTDIKVSSICLGTMTWGQQNTQKEAFAQMDTGSELTEYHQQDRQLRLPSDRANRNVERSRSTRDLWPESAPRTVPRPALP